jgi:hypothetical protein
MTEDSGEGQRASRRACRKSLLARAAVPAAQPRQVRRRVPRRHADWTWLCPRPSMASWPHTSRRMSSGRQAGVGGHSSTGLDGGTPHPGRRSTRRPGTPGAVRRRDGTSRSVVHASDHCRSSTTARPSCPPRHRRSRRCEGLRTPTVAGSATWVRSSALRAVDHPQCRPRSSNWTRRACRTSLPRTRAPLVRGGCPKSDARVQIGSCRARYSGVSRC